MIWKPSNTQKAFIREQAAKAAHLSPRQIILELGIFGNSPNIMMGTTDPIMTWETGAGVGVDLSEFMTWQEFVRAGVPLDEDGRAILDFYIYSRGYGGSKEELLDNLKVWVLETELSSRPVIIAISSSMKPKQSELFVESVIY